MKKRLVSLLLLLCGSFGFRAAAQQVDSIYFNLYTDSLKKGSLHFNYINLDGKLSNGSYIPLDTTHVKLATTAGVLKGNVLQLDSNETAAFVVITATLRSNPLVQKQTRIYIKKVYNDELLKNEGELIEGWRRKPGTKN